MHDLRLYSRLNVNVLCSIYANNTVEVISVIKNISESGIYLEVGYSDELFKLLEVGLKMKMQGIDSFNYFEDIKTLIFNEDLIIVRIENKLDKIGIACKVSGYNRSYYKYITDLKVSNYVSKSGI